jgi:hypothetical protein
MAYEVFNRTKIRIDTPTVSIVADGRIVLNSAAARTLSSRGIRFVLLLWDSAIHTIALKAAAKGYRDAFAVSLGNHSGSLRAKSFLAHIGWNAPVRQTLPAVWNENDKRFEVMLPPAFLRPPGTVEKQPKSRRI